MNNNTQQLSVGSEAVFNRRLKVNETLTVVKRRL